MLRETLAALLVMSGAASSAEITEDVLPEGVVFRVSGEFNLHDDRKFIKAVLPHDRAIVIFGDSVGGSLDAAIGIGKAIKLKQFHTSVAEGASCASACAYAWLAGQKRFMEPNARVGFHAAYTLEGGKDTTISGSGNAMIGAYLNELDLSIDAIIYVTNAGPESISWLDVAQANVIGIQVGNLGESPPTKPKIETSLWEHNGSTVALEPTDDKRKFIYEKPNADVPVQKGTILFEGTKTSDTYSGTAYRFSTNCGPFKYEVKGPVSSDQNLVTLFGKAPVLSGCQISGYRDDVLVFRYLQQQQSVLSRL